MNKYYYKKAAGLTLIELMIAITLGMLVISAVFFVFLEVKQSSRQNENFGRMQENARFALRAISYDLSHAGFFAGMLKGDDVTINGTAAGTIDKDCGSSAGVKWLTDLSTPIEYTAEQSGPIPSDHICIDDLVDKTATLAIRSAANTFISTVPAGTIDANHTYVRTNGSVGCIWFAAETNSIPTDDTLCPATDTGVDDWALKSTIYYVSNVDSKLCRKVVDQGAFGMTTECLVEGVERFHIDFGFDQDGDGYAERYGSNSIPKDASDINSVDFNEIVSARIYVLIRSPDIDAFYTNTKTYDMGTLGNIDPDDDHYYRRVFSTTVLLRNLANLRNF